MILFPNANFILYADNTNLFVVGKTEEEAFFRANNVLQKVRANINYSLLHINMLKFCFMHFILNKLPESSYCSRTVPIVSNNHVCKAIYINGHKLIELAMSNTKF